MMINDCIFTSVQFKQGQQTAGYFNHRFIVRLAEHIFAFVEITDMLDTDPIDVRSFDSCRDDIHVSANHGCPVRERGEVLSDFVEAPLKMAFFHALAKFKVIASVKVFISRDVGMMLLNK